MADPVEQPRGLHNGQRRDKEECEAPTPPLLQRARQVEQRQPLQHQLDHAQARGQPEHLVSEWGKDESRAAVTLSRSSTLYPCCASSVGLFSVL